MSDDLIKRSDAIMIMACEMYAEAQSQGYEVDSIEDFMPEAKSWMNDAPSADRPQGEWIDEADKYDASFGIHDYRCSNCNSYADEYIGGHEWYTADKPNFCPNCGARMKGADDE